MRMKGTGKSVKKRKKDSDLKENVVFNIQSIIMSVLMAITLVTIVTMGFLLYQRFKLAIDKMAVSNTEATVESTVDRVNSDLLDIRQIFDAANYNIVQEFDISSEKFAEQYLSFCRCIPRLQPQSLYACNCRESSTAQPLF